MIKGYRKRIIVLLSDEEEENWPIDKTKIPVHLSNNELTRQNYISVSNDTEIREKGNLFTSDEEINLRMSFCSDEDINTTSNENQRATECNTELYALKINKKQKKQKTWDKKQSCKYCSKLVQKLPRHLELKHKNENEVKLLMKLSKNSSPRRILLEKIKNEGNFIHNINVWRKGSGEIITKRRLNFNKNFNDKTAEDYAPCEGCFSTFRAKYLYRHKNICPFISRNQNDKLNDFESHYIFGSDTPFSLRTFQNTMEYNRENVIALNEKEENCQIYEAPITLNVEEKKIRPIEEKKNVVERKEENIISSSEKKENCQIYDGPIILQVEEENSVLMEQKKDVISTIIGERKDKNMISSTRKEENYLTNKISSNTIDPIEPDYQENENDNWSLSENENSSKISSSNKGENLNMANNKSKSSKKSCHENESTKLNTLKINKKLKKQRTWDKKQACKYCFKLIQKLPRHLELKHKNEVDVKFLIKLDKNSSPRRKLLEKIKNEGNYIHNRNVWRKGSGEIITKRRLTYGKILDDKTVEDYVPCEGCFSTFHAKYLYRHRSTCSFISHKKDDDSVENESRYVRGHAALLLPTSQNTSKHFKETVLKKMKVDSLFHIIRKDEVILKLGEKIFDKIGSNEKSVHHISQKMREMARVLHEIRKISGNNSKTLISCLRPSEVKLVISAIKIVAGYNEENKKYRTPSIALKLGHSLRKCVTIFRGIAIEEENEELKDHINNFLIAFNSKFNIISSGALKTLETKKLKKPITLPLLEDKSFTLPLSEDIKYFNMYLQNNPVSTEEKILPNYNILEATHFIAQLTNC